MSNETERRELVKAAVEIWQELGACIASTTPRVAGERVIDQFLNTSASADWGPGAWQTYTRLNGLRKAANIMGFRLDIEDLQELTDNPRAKLHMLPKP